MAQCPPPECFTRIFVVKNPSTSHQLTAVRTLNSSDERYRNIDTLSLPIVGSLKKSKYLNCCPKKSFCQAWCTSKSDLHVPQHRMSRCARCTIC